jgi:hypothetical protein
MSRLARGRAMLREAWLKVECKAGQKAEQKDEQAREREEQLK